VCSEKLPHPGLDCKALKLVKNLKYEEREREERERDRQTDCQAVPGMSFNMSLRFSETEKQTLAWVFTENVLYLMICISYSKFSL
jgi:hypothetical protein